jgi:agmatinase
MLKMNNLRFYTSPPIPFSGCSMPLQEASYVVIGVPYDKTSTYRPGSRFAPAAIREASVNIETYSLRSDMDVEDVKICDIGDLEIVEDKNETLNRLKLVLSDVIKAAKVPIVIGGEHTITYGAAQAYGKDIAIINFDAHLDLRDEYLKDRLSHTTFMRRLSEEIGPDRIIEVGTRAVCKDELKYAKEVGLTYISTYEIRRLGVGKVAETIKLRLSKFGRIYVTIDMDVLDPSYAPAVANPEGDGLSSNTLITMIRSICNNKVVGLDLVEVTPHYDNGVTAIQSAKILFEAICAIENSRKIANVE